jgi:hypothetical protein
MFDRAFDLSLSIGIVQKRLFLIMITKQYFMHKIAMISPIFSSTKLKVTNPSKLTFF